MSAVAANRLRLENRHTGEVLEITRQRQNGAEILLLAGTLGPKAAGPPMHIHFLEDEDGTVTAGVLSAEVGGKRVDVRPGETVLLPRGVPHRWWNEGDAPLAFNASVRPAVDMDRYLQAVFEVMNASPPGRPSLFYVAHLAVRHGRTQTVLMMPLALQRVVFRAVVMLGTVMGRYRGTDWPGSPARCTGTRLVAESGQAIDR